MATETQQAPAAPDLTIINRIGSIPLVSSSLSTIHSTLSTSRLTASPYATASAVSLAAYGTASKYATSPAIASRLAPLVARADGYANAAVDAVESRYPYPFHASPEEVKTALLSRSDEARDVANKTIDDRVRQPATRVVTGIDQRFAPLVDYLEAYISKLSPATSPTHSPSSSSSSLEGEQQQPQQTTYQYQRALTLSRNLRDNLYALSGEQLAALRQQSALVQRASDTAAGLAGGAHALSDKMVAELQSVRAATHDLPAHVQGSLTQLTTELGTTIHDLSSILGDKQLSTSEKVQEVRTTVQTRVQPLLDRTTARLKEVLGALGTKGAQSKKKVAETYESTTVKETEVAQAAREHAEQTREAGATYADAAKGEADAVANENA